MKRKPIKGDKLRGPAAKILSQRRPVQRTGKAITPKTVYNRKRRPAMWDN